jgi:hypothetical protein
MTISMAKKTKMLIPITAISLLLGILFDRFLIGHLPGVSVLAYIIIALGASFYLAKQHGIHVTKAHYVLTLLILFFAAMIAIRASSVIASFNILIITYLIFLGLRLTLPSNAEIGETGKTTAKLRDYNLNDYFSKLIGLLPRIVKRAAHETEQLIQDTAGLKHNTTYKPYLRGMLITLPILLLFLLLLSSADLVFKQFINSIFSFHVDVANLFHLLLMLFIASLFTGAYALVFLPAHSGLPATDRPSRIPKLKLSMPEVTILLGSVSALFFIFIVIQIAYLFGGAHHVLSSAYTYADYARKGFFELIAVATISMVLIVAVKKSVAIHTAHHNLMFKSLCGVLISEVVVIMISAHSRLSLYENAYGFTVLRLLSHMFIFWLAVSFVLLFTYIVREERESHFAFRIFVNVMAFFVIFNLINPDALVAHQNISRFNATGKVDAYYLTTLSEDATPVVSTLLDSRNLEVQRAVADNLYRERLHASRPLAWQSANLSRMHARSILRQKADQLPPPQFNIP